MTGPGGLSRAAHALLERRGHLARDSGPVRRAAAGPERLSHPQLAQWLFTQVYADRNAGALPKRLHLRGALNRTALSRALGEIVRRHDVLRSGFFSGGDEPVQVVRDAPVIEVTEADLGSLPPGARAEAAERLFGEDANRPFDLTADILLRPLLVRLDEDEYELQLTFHQIAFDGWSTGVLLRELGVLYAAYAAGSPSPLAEPPLQYADFAAWERAQDAGPAREADRRFWQRELEGATTVLELPTDRPRAPVRGLRIERVTSIIPASLTQRLSALAEEEGATLFAVTFAAFQVLVGRRTQQDDFVLGVVTANRTHRIIENLVGSFMAVLPLRTRLDGVPSFRTHLQRTRDRVTEALAHQSYPFQRFVEDLRPAHALSAEPLFPVVFNYRSMPLELPAPPGLEVSDLRSSHLSTPFDLHLNVTPVEGTLRLELEYDPDRFDPDTTRRWCAGYQALLEGVVADPDASVAVLPVMPATERRQVLETWSGSRETVPARAARTLHGWFETMAAATPDAIAVRCADHSLSYAELNARANRLARHLEDCGVGTGSLVGLYAEPSLDLIVGVLGVLKAGAAYLPIDLAYPAERRGFMLEDAGARVLLTQRSLRTSLSEIRARIVCFEDVSTDGGAGNREGGATPDDAAYVIYTSGSTGAPKGVVVTHRNVSRLFSSTEPWFGFGPRDVWALFHSIAFDFSVWEMWGALLYGGRLVVVPYLVTRAPAPLWELLVREGVTVLNQTPLAFRQLMEAEPERAAPPALRYVIFGGDALDVGMLAPWFARHGDRRPQLVNMYGITETTVHVSYRPVGAGDLSAGSVIGRPIPDLFVYVLDRQGQPVPIGVPGELYIGGAGLAREYLNRPELTSERFVRLPLRELPEQRLYRSGDRARFLPGGDLEFLGRVDRQVKLRGFRIELGEVESGLSSCPGVAKVVALLHQESGDSRLEAYYTSAAGTEPTPEALRLHALQRLPKYMVPGLLVPVATIPLTRNGKVDVAALRTLAPDGGTGDSAAAPHSIHELLVARIWERLLPGVSFGIRDDFFEIGGHSLLAARMIHEIEAQTGVRVPFATLFQGATIERIARYLVARTESAEHSEVIQVTPGREGVRPFFMLHGDLTGGGFYCHALARAAGTDRPFYAIPPCPPAEGPDTMTIEGMARRHLMAVRRVQPKGPYRLGGYCVGGLTAFEMARQLRAAGEAVELLLLVDANAINASFKWLRPGVKAIAALTETDPVDRIEREAYLMFRTREAAVLPAGERLRWAAGFVLGFLGRRVGRAVSRLGAPGPMKAPGPTEPEPSREKQIRMHHDRAMHAYHPGTYDGRVDLVWATNRRGSSRPIFRAWRRVAREVHVQEVPANHIEVVLTEVPELLRRALERVDADGA
jgi:amino acid adenylation domain-containing protein